MTLPNPPQWVSSLPWVSPLLAHSPTAISWDRLPKKPLWGLLLGTSNQTDANTPKGLAKLASEVRKGHQPGGVKSGRFA